MLRDRKRGGILLLVISIVALHSNMVLSFWLVKWEITCLMEYEHLRSDVCVGKYVCFFLLCSFNAHIITFSV